METTTFKQILVPTDFGESSDRALAMAADLAVKFGASLTVLHTYEVPVYGYPGVVIPADLSDSIRDAAQKHLDRQLTEIRKRIPKAEGILSLGIPWREIGGAIERIHADLVVMGTHGRRGVNRMLVGSVTEKIVRTCPVPVLTVH
jgi:nucleotide-binding universal stress UspA family protein